MNRVIIHVHVQRSEGPMDYDLEVPAHLPAERLSRHLAHALNWHSDDFDYHFQVQWPPNKSLKPTQTLAEADLWEGTHLVLSRTPKPRLTPPPQKIGERKQAQLRSLRTGKSYAISLADMIIGRSTPNTPLTERKRLIDLKEEPDGDTVSRKHARLFLKKGQWYLEVLKKTRNRTFCNDRQVEADESCLLHDGDQLKFGRVMLVFHDSL